MIYRWNLVRTIFFCTGIALAYNVILINKAQDPPAIPQKAVNPVSEVQGILAVQLPVLDKIGRTTTVADIVVNLKDLKTQKVIATGKTSRSGRYIIPDCPVGTYRVHWEAPGFISGQSAQTIEVKNQLVSSGGLEFAIPEQGVIFGRVTLKDGSPAGFSDTFWNVDVRPQVNLIDANGKIVKSVFVNDQGEYLLSGISGVPAQVRANCESSSVVSAVPARPARLDLRLPSSAPRIVGLYAKVGDQRIRQAAPGAIVGCFADVEYAEKERLKFKWKTLDDPAPNLKVAQSRQTSETTLTLPKTPGLYSIYLLVWNGKGGYARATLRISSGLTGTLPELVGNIQDDSKSSNPIFDSTVAAATTTCVRVLVDTDKLRLPFNLRVTIPVSGGQPVLRTLLITEPLGIIADLPPNTPGIKLEVLDFDGQVVDNSTQLVDSKEAADPGPYPFKCPSEVKLTAKLPAGTNNNNFLSYNDVPPTTSEDADAYYATIDPRAEVGLGTLLKSEVTPNDVAQVTGVGTNFGTFFNRDGGDIIRAAGQVRTIIRIESDTILRINSPFNPPIVANTQYEKVGEKTTFLRWKAKNGFPEQGNEGEDASAIYFNAGDLGFGRSMHMKRLSAANIAYYVSNYPTVDDARQDTNRIATVAMEYSAVVPNGQRFTKFYVFNNDNNGNKNDGVRVNQADLDNNGGKFVPTLCITCHGGRKGTPKDGVYPLDGNVGAHFLPFDLESYRYSELLTRAAQEAAFKKLNVTLLETEPVTSFAIKNLVDGWYGGSAHPRNDADSSFVPDGWRTPTDKSLLYNAVVKTSCRSCHIARADLSLDWRVFDNGTPSGFKRNTTIPFLVDEIDVLDGFFKLKMPQSKLTYQNHWFSTSPHHRPATLRFERAIAVDPISGLVTTRMGGIATFTVTLMTNPTSDVTIAVTSSNTAEGTVSPATLVFTHQDQAINSPQTLKVTITGVNDPNPGDVAYKILLDKATSADPFYNGMKPQDVNVINK